MRPTSSSGANWSKRWASIRSCMQSAVSHSAEPFASLIRKSTGRARFVGFVAAPLPMELTSALRPPPLFGLSAPMNVPSTLKYSELISRACCACWGRNGKARLSALLAEYAPAANVRGTCYYRCYVGKEFRLADGFILPVHSFAGRRSSGLRLDYWRPDGCRRIRRPGWKWIAPRRRDILRRGRR
jgi:hypothetical protein